MKKDLSIECNNFRQPTFPYINYALLNQCIPCLEDALSIKKLLESFFKNIKLYGCVQCNLYGEAYKIAEKNGIDLRTLIGGDLDFFT
jgi:hypothetical protein